MLLLFALEKAFTVFSIFLILFNNVYYLNTFLPLPLRNSNFGQLFLYNQYTA